MKKTNNENAVVLANAVELSAQVVSRIAGNGVSNVIGGNVVTTGALRNAVAAKIQSKFNKHMGEPK